ncbi:MAG: hypothetical protein ACRER8_16780 [Pseudomonas sp.]|uniref:hypothetical protein n=1 Tax=Pseudomonas sp. TaxID=306 RepID=UPI003D6FB3E2
MLNRALLLWVKRGIHSATDWWTFPLTAADRKSRTLAFEETPFLSFFAASRSLMNIGAELECHLPATV